MSTAEPERFDLVLAGGGLANGLIAWRLHARRPDLRVLMVEAEPTVGGNHTWSFHDADLDDAQREWLRPFVVHRWSRQGVLFPGRQRWLHAPYNAITSTRFHELLTKCCAHSLRLSTPIAEVEPTRLRTLDGRVIEAGAVIDGRGFCATPHLELRYQKFVGLELQLARPHGLPGPIIMDARVAQHDGYRFVYVLPLADDRLLIEDTYYSDQPALDAELLHQRVLAYAAEQRFAVARTLREEQGILPIALDGDIEAFWAHQRRQPCSGLRAALFHPTTGYSLPQAARLADLIASLDDLSAPSLASAIGQHARAVWRSQAFFRALNRMLFLAGSPQTRHEVLAHFYRLPERTVGRFYGERLSVADKLRIVTGKPPVPVGAALRAMFTPQALGRAG